MSPEEMLARLDSMVKDYNALHTVLIKERSLADAEIRDLKLANRALRARVDELTNRVSHIEAAE